MVERMTVSKYQFAENRSVRRRVAWIGFGMQRRCA